MSGPADEIAGHVSGRSQVDVSSAGINEAASA
jgi:hypothetical protein